MDKKKTPLTAGAAAGKTSYSSIVTQWDAVEQFREAIIAAGLPAPKTIEADGKLHRFSTNGKPGDLSGWYVLHLDGTPAGIFGCWRSGIKETWVANLGRKLTADEIAAQREAIERMRRLRDEEELKHHEEAARRAAAIWDAAEPATERHPYLRRKGIKPHGTRVIRFGDCAGWLAVPMYDASGKLWNMERIAPEKPRDGGPDKKGLFHGKRTGCFYLIGTVENARALLICEGFATGASLHEATGLPVAVAFNAGNLRAVAEALRGKYPDLTLVICGDDDFRTPGNPGRTKAQAAALAVGAVAVFPEFAERKEGQTDFNDLHVAEGLDAVKRIIDAALANGAPAAANHVAKLLTLARDGNAAEFWRALKSEALESLRRLRDEAPSDYEAFRAELKAACSRISITALDRLVRGESFRTTQATELAELAGDRCTLWHDPDGEAFASFEGSAGELQHWRIDSSGFRDWLSRLAFAELGIAPASETIKSATLALAGRAKFDGEEHTPARRVAKTEDGYWLDMGDQRWRAILMTESGWRVVERPPVRFLRTKATRPFPEPAASGNVERLWDLVNVPEADRLLVLTWLLECWRADTPYALLEITGEQGAAKSTAQRILRMFVDPNDVPLRGRPKTVEDIYVAASNAHLLSFENLSTLSADHSDALCAICTGAGFAARQLYTDGEEALLKAHRPVVLNGINPVVTRPDLLDRAVSLHLPRLAHRKTDEQVRQAVEAAAPTIFAGLLDLFCAALRVLPKVKAERLPLPRMADFAQLGEAVARVLGHRPRHFIELYAEHRRECIRRTIDASPVALAIVRMVESGRSFRGTVGDLLDLLNRERPEHEANEYWPRSPRGLGDALRRYAPALAQIGIKAEVSQTRSAGRVTCEIDRLPEEMFFSQAQTVENDVTDVTNVTNERLHGDVEDVGDVVSPLNRLEKKFPPGDDVVTDSDFEWLEV